MFRLKSQIEKRFSVALSYQEIAEDATIVDIAALIDLKLHKDGLANIQNETSDNVEIMDW